MTIIMPINRLRIYLLINYKIKYVVIMIISQYPLKLEHEDLKCITCDKKTQIVFFPRNL